MIQTVTPMIAWKTPGIQMVPLVCSCGFPVFIRAWGLCSEDQVLSTGEHVNIGMDPKPARTRPLHIRHGLVDFREELLPLQFIQAPRNNQKRNHRCYQWPRGFRSKCNLASAKKEQGVTQRETKGLSKRIVGSQRD